MNQVRELQSISHELLYLGIDGTPIYTDRFCQLNTEVFRLSESLFFTEKERRTRKRLRFALRC